MERYVEKKKESLKKPSEAGAEEAKKEGEDAAGFQNGEGDEKNEAAKSAVEEPKKEEEPKKDETEPNKENDTTVFGLVTDEDREADREALEKLTNMIEERMRTKPPPPPPPPMQKVDGVDNTNSEMPAKSGDKDSEVEDAKTGGH